MQVGIGFGVSSRGAPLDTSPPKSPRLRRSRNPRDRRDAWSTRSPRHACTRRSPSRARRRRSSARSRAAPRTPLPSAASLSAWSRLRPAQARRRSRRRRRSAVRSRAAPGGSSWSRRSRARGRRRHRAERAGPRAARRRKQRSWAPGTYERPEGSLARSTLGIDGTGDRTGPRSRPRLDRVGCDPALSRGRGRRPRRLRAIELPMFRLSFLSKAKSSSSSCVVARGLQRALA